MNNPVWHLLARVNLFGSSQGWYRFKLIDQFINHFGDWWLVGSDNYSAWFLWGLEDLTNQYVLEGVRGGLLTLLLFLAVIMLAFWGIGRARQHLEGDLDPDRLWQPGASARVVLTWGLGASLVVHCVSFFGVSYFGQVVMLWYMTLGMIGSATPLAVVRRVPRVILRVIRPRTDPSGCGGFIPAAGSLVRRR